MTEYQVERNEEQRRYDLFADGQLAGFAQYRETGERTAFTHTEVFEEYRGGGAAVALAAASLADAAARERVIVPLCPFMARYLRRHDVPGATVDWPDDA